MCSGRPGHRLVNLLSFGRFLGSLLFACIAFQAPPPLVASIYAVTAISDVVDGAFARRFHVSSYSGRVLDIISDKSLTAVSMLYAAACGIDLLPLSVIAARDVLVLGARLIVVAGSPLLTTSRWFGGLLASCIWGSTFVLIILRNDSTAMAIVQSAYRLAGLAAAANLAIRLYRARARIRSTVEGVERLD